MKQSALQLERATRGKKNRLLILKTDGEWSDVFTVFVSYLDARIYGTDEEDVGEYDEDTDVDSQHDRGAERDNTDSLLLF